MDNFFREKILYTTWSFQFLKVNSLMADTIKKQHFYKQIAEFNIHERFNM